MRKAYLKQFSAGYIKGRGKRTDWQGYKIKQENAEKMHRKEKEILNSEGFVVGDTWARGPVPRDVVLEKLASSLTLMQTDRLQKLQVYNKLVLSETDKSKVTMFFSGADVFLIEDFPDGTFRESLQCSSTKRMKDLFIAGQVPWRD